ncbi:MAG: iron-sulfur cluster assembly scaffold protein [bacterium]
MEYTKEVLDHFQNPRNVGEIKDADGVGQVGNMKCGDVMYTYIKVGSRPSSVGSNELQTANRKPQTEEYIEDVKFKTLGCAAAIASSSMMTELAKGKSLTEIEKLSRDDINEALGVLPKQKYHCSILSADAIHKAVEDYRSRKKEIK